MPLTRLLLASGTTGVCAALLIEYGALGMAVVRCAPSRGAPSAAQCWEQRRTVENVDRLTAAVLTSVLLGGLWFIRTDDKIPPGL